MLTVHASDKKDPLAMFERPYDSKHYVNILKGAKDYLKDKNNWTKGQFFHGDKCCMLGAISRSEGTCPMVDDPASSIGYIESLFDRIPKAPWFPNIAEFNDGSTHKEVMEMFDKLIAIAEDETKNV